MRAKTIEEILTNQNSNNFLNKESKNLFNSLTKGSFIIAS